MSNTTTKSVIQDGDIVTWSVTVTNTSETDCKDTKVVFTIPAGVSLTGPSSGGLPEILVSKGSYDSATNTWWLGDVKAGQAHVTDFEFTVDDITLTDPIDGYFTVTAVMTSICTEDTADNTTHLVITVALGCEDVILSVGSGEDVDVDISIG